jgi:hypothetical protein
MTSRMISSLAFWAFRMRLVSWVSLSAGTRMQPVECCGLVPRWKRIPVLIGEEARGEGREARNTNRHAKSVPVSI